MGNDESSGLKKNNSGGKADFLGTGLGLVPGATSGLRRTTRIQSNSSSPSSVKKSQRFEKGCPETETSNPLRRSGRENKFQFSSSGKGSLSMNKGGLKQKNNKGCLSTARGSRKENISKEIANVEECRIGDETSKEITQEARVKEKEGSSPKVGEKRKKRLDAREFKAMFRLYRVSEPKKRRLGYSYGNAGGDVGGLSETISENCEQGVDDVHMKIKEGLQEKCDEDGDSGLGNCDRWVQEKPDEDPGRGIEGPDEDPQVCRNGEEMEDCVTITDDVTEGQHLKTVENLCVRKPTEVKDVEGQLLSGGSYLPCTAETLAEKNSVNVVAVDVNSCVAEKPPHQEIPSVSGNGSLFSQNVLIRGSVVDGEGTKTGMKIIQSGSPAFKLSSLTEDCDKYSKNPRLDHDSQMHELSCRLSNSVAGPNFDALSKDRGECADAADEDGGETHQSDSLAVIDHSLCVICNRAGDLLRCNGKACRRSYHPSCLWTHEENAHIPNFCCPECMKKKLALGVHSVSEGIESIFDAREVEVSTSEGSLEKQYFVKYKGLAHIHNCWVAETQLLVETPDLLAKVKEQDKSWRPEWAVPHRLLFSRLIIAGKQDAEFASKGHHMWLVKWCGLDYDQATWELEDSEFFMKPKAQQLLKEYKTRQNEAKNSTISGNNKIQERKKNLPVKHGRPSDNLRSECVNKLREHHHKRHNAVLLDEQDRTIKIVYFISSILSIVHRPFLIIAPRESLSYWEAEFLRYTTSINVVVYAGNAYSRKIIRTLEFYQEGGGLMLQVLLSSVEAIYEDLEEIKRMDWEAIIVDDCQEHCILGNSDCIKTLVTSWKLLLFNAQLKDTIAEYVNILSLLDSVGSSNQGLMDASNKDINVLKEMLCSFIVSPRLQEYWVPVEISNVQLEQYCSLMLSNLSVLCLSSKSDSIGSLHGVLCSAQKCCDHPYLVNPSLRTFLLPEQPPQDAALDMGVKASGKLQLLDELLSEFRNQGLKVLILYQPIGGSGKNNLDIILDDFLTWRFGEDSYEHIAFGGQPSTRKAALTKFNKERVRTFLLLETRACGSSVKLSSVDSVIILNSNWNPLNDLRDLQKIVIDSKLKPIPVFRFYCSCTVEEKALIISKSDYTIPENTQQISSSTKQMLLMWGSSYLFSRLEEFHNAKVHDYRENIVFGSSVMKDVFKEIVSVVQNHGNVNNPSQYLSLARQDGRRYVTNIPLLREQRTQLEEGVSSNSFWVKLLDGKQPHWKYLSKSSERSRKRVHYSDKLSLPRNVQSEEQPKKHKDHSPRRVGQNYGKIRERNKENHGFPDIRILQQDDRKHLHEQRGLFDILKPTMLRLCETLIVKDGVKRLAVKFLGFVLDNHQVTREPETILQAFQISVCWIAAEVLEKNIDHGKSLDIAREKMNFKCLVQEAETVYSKMKLLMKVFLSQNLHFLKSPDDPASAIDDSTGIIDKNGINIPVDIDESSLNRFEKECPLRMHIGNNIKDSLENADRLQKKCEKKFNRLKEKQNDEFVDFEKKWEQKRVELEDTYKLELAVIRYSHANSSALVDKLKILDHTYAKKRKDLESQVCDLRKKLEARQRDERDGEQKKIAQLLKLVKPLAQEVRMEKPQSAQTIEGIGPYKVSDGILPATTNLLEDQNSVGNENLAGEKIPRTGLTPGASIEPVPVSCSQECLIENQFAHSEEAVEVTSHMHAVLADKPSTLESNGGNMSIQQLLSPISELMELPADETLCQVEGVEEQVRILAEIGGISPASETSLLESANPVPGSPHRVASNGQLNSQLTEVQVSIQNSFSQKQHLIPQPTHTVAADIGLSPTYVSATGGASTLRASHPIPLQVANPTISRGSSSYYADPLQHEYDRLQNEIGEITSSHEQTKLRLKSECDKEIEEVVAQIRRKYNAKLEEAESSFSDKKSELESNKKMVMMNKFLADALRSKSMDYKVAQQGGPQKGGPSSSMDLQRLQPTTRSSLIASSSSMVRTASNPDSTSPPVRYVLPDEGIQLMRQGIRSAVPQVPHISAPPATSLLYNMQSSSVWTSQHANNHGAVHLPHIPTPPTVTSSNNNLAGQRPSIQSCHGGSHQSKAFTSAPPLNLSFGANEFLMDVAIQNDADIRRLSDNLPALPENVQNHESWDLSQFAADVVVTRQRSVIGCI